MSSIYDSYMKVRDEVREAAVKSGRSENSVALMAVSKFHNAAEIEEAVDAGAALFGENRVQEACAKFPDIIARHPQIVLHQIGVLQRNKVKSIVPLARCIQSVDRLDLLKSIDAAAKSFGKRVEILFEWRTGEESKSGFSDYGEAAEAFEFARHSVNVELKGLMTMAPLSDDEKIVRRAFQTLRQVQERASREFPDLRLTELSMGMSGDFKIAIEEGSTLVRIGTRIFGERKLVAVMPS